MALICRWYAEEEEDEDVVSFWVIIIELSGLEEQQQQQLKELLFPNWFIGRDFIIITANHITMPPTTVIDRKYAN